MASLWYCGPIQCPNCQSPISADNAFCPYCSSTAPMTAPWQRGRWWSLAVLAGVVAAAGLSDCLLGTGLIAWLTHFLKAKGS